MSAAFSFIAPLFVPGDRPERFAKAAASGADAVVLDLEDAVAVENKDRAREGLFTDFADVPVLLRVNGAGTRWHAGDLAAAAALDVDAIVLPKAQMDGALDAIVAGSGAHVPVIALVETARGLAEAPAIAGHPSVVRLAFGSIDFSADLGCQHTREALLLARSKLVLASRLADLPAPLDGVTTAIDDVALVTDDARHGRSLGFGGKLCIHPKQVEAVKAGYLPVASEIAWAERVLASGDGAVAVDGAMVDEPVRIRARNIIALVAQR